MAAALQCPMVDLRHRLKRPSCARRASSGTVITAPVSSAGSLVNEKGKASCDHDRRPRRYDLRQWNRSDRRVDMHSGPPAYYTDHDRGRGRDLSDVPVADSAATGPRLSQPDAQGEGSTLAAHRLCRRRQLPHLFPQPNKAATSRSKASAFAGATSALLRRAWCHSGDDRAHRKGSRRSSHCRRLCWPRG